jgi:rubrerythrin
MTDAEKLRQAIEEDVYVGDLADLGPILVAEIKRLQAELDRAKTAQPAQQYGLRCRHCAEVVEYTSEDRSSIEGWTYGFTFTDGEGWICPDCQASTFPD